MKMQKLSTNLRMLTDEELDLVGGGTDEEIGPDVVVTYYTDSNRSGGGGGGGGGGWGSFGGLSGYGAGYGYGSGGGYGGQASPATIMPSLDEWEDTNGNGVLGDEGDYIIARGPSTSHWFGSLGVSLGPIGAGASYGGGQLYAYHSVGWGATPVDFTVGYASDVDKYLGGVGVSANGLPGAGASFDENGQLTATAWTFGTPGADVSYEVNVTQGFNNAVAELSHGLYEMLWHSYDQQLQQSQER